MKCAVIILACLAAALVLRPVESIDCVAAGTTVTQSCAQFTNAGHQGAGDSCAQIVNVLNGNPAAYSPSAQCCTDAITFFGAGCACDPNTQSLAASVLGYTIANMKTSNRAAILKCGGAANSGKCSAEYSC